MFGCCLVNDWSARGIQFFEIDARPASGQELLTTISPWIVTMEALAPFRVAARGRASEPAVPALSARSGRTGSMAVIDIELTADLVRRLQQIVRDQPHGAVLDARADGRAPRRPTARRSRRGRPDRDRHRVGRGATKARACLAEDLQPRGGISDRSSRRLAARLAGGWRHARPAGPGRCGRLSCPIGFGDCSGTIQPARALHDRRPPAATATPIPSRRAASISSSTSIATWASRRPTRSCQAEISRSAAGHQRLHQRQDHGGQSRPVRRRSAARSTRSTSGSRTWTGSASTCRRSSPSPGQYFYFADPETGRDAAARRQRRHGRGRRAASGPPGRHGHGAAPECGDGGGGDAPLRRELDLRGIEIGSNVNGDGLPRGGIAAVLGRGQRSSASSSSSTRSASPQASRLERLLLQQPHRQSARIHARRSVT